MRLTEALAAYQDARTEREQAITVGYDYARVGRAVTALLAAQAGLLARCEADLPALLTVVETARMAHRVYSADWDGPSLRTLGAALAALDQRGEEGTS